MSDEAIGILLGFISVGVIGVVFYAIYVLSEVFFGDDDERLP